MNSWRSPIFFVACFVGQIPTIAEAALTGEIEQLKGVTENVIVGANIPVGTGTVDLYMKVIEDG